MFGELRLVHHSKIAPAMTGYGLERTSSAYLAMSAFSLKADKDYSIRPIGSKGGVLPRPYDHQVPAMPGTVAVPRIYCDCFDFGAWPVVIGCDLAAWPVVALGFALACWAMQLLT